MITSKFLALAALASLIVGCAVLPTGPSVLVLPGVNKPFEQFRAEDVQCRQYALAQAGGETPGQSAQQSGAGSAMTGTAVGAAAGAAIGGGKGAAIGAGSGLLAGTLAGSGAAAATGYEAQQRYDMSYIQCMYAYGNRVPVSGNFIDSGPLEAIIPYPEGSYIFPPPPSNSQKPALPER